MSDMLQLVEVIGRGGHRESWVSQCKVTDKLKHIGHGARTCGRP